MRKKERIRQLEVEKRMRKKDIMTEIVSSDRFLFMFLARAVDI